MLHSDEMKFLAVIIVISGVALSAFSHDAPPCIQCPQGPPGVHGRRGEKGSRGETGLQGKVGPAGPAGTDGRINITAIEEIVERKIQAIFSAKSCADVDLEDAKVRQDTGGVFDIVPEAFGLVEQYCDTESDGGGWTVFQRRFDGSVDFYRGWNDYVNGFGDKKGEFWLGLEEIHQMTNRGDHELRIDIETRRGQHFYAQYGTFAISAASDYYRLSVGEHSGNASEALTEMHHNRQFTTYDADHDLNNGNCARRFRGAWWYYSCFTINLNGPFDELYWHGYLSSVEMKLRKKA